MVTSRFADRTSKCAASFLVSEQRGAFADERLARRYWPSGAPAVYAHDWPITSRQPRGAKRYAACGTRGRAARPSPGASEAAQAAQGRRAARPLNGWPTTLYSARSCSGSAACRNVRLVCEIVGTRARMRQTLSVVSDRLAPASRERVRCRKLLREARTLTYAGRCTPQRPTNEQGHRASEVS